MARHVAERLTRPDRDLNAAIGNAWPQLPAALRTTATNIATIRLGVTGYALILPASIVSSAQRSTPAEFAANLLTPVAGIVGLIAAVTILYLRATRTSPLFVDAYKTIMPDMADRIESRYGTPGLGDLIAPWIRAPEGLGKRILSWIAAKLHLKP
ncbi:MAG: hypothetical protein K2X84_06035 [Beijerinckiaceae bacterium]|nr:hypothetical protein [Beijerinckiaceae bacterium]